MKHYMKLPKNIRKHIREAKCLLRKKSLSLAEEQKAISDLYAKFAVTKKEAYAGEAAK